MLIPGWGSDALESRLGTVIGRCLQDVASGGMDKSGVSWQGLKSATRVPRTSAKWTRKQVTYCARDLSRAKEYVGTSPTTCPPTYLPTLVKIKEIPSRQQLHHQPFFRHIQLPTHANRQNGERPR